MSKQTIQEGSTVTEPGVNIDNSNGNGSAEKVDVSSEIEKVKIELEQKFKSEIAGLNRRNSELENLIKQKELEGKTEEERNTLLKEENKRIQEENAKLERERIIDRELSNAGLPLEFAKRITGMDEANIKEDIRVMKEYVDSLVQDKADGIIKERLAGKPPESGVTEPGKQMTRADFDRLDQMQRAEAVKQKVKILD